MPLDENEIEDRSSSTDLAQDGQAAEAVANANSSDATGETDDSLLSVVRDVVAESRQSEEAAPPAAGAEGDGAEPPEGQSSDEDDFSNVPFNQHPRFKALVTERNRYREEARGAQQDAERYRNVQTFIDNHGLTAEEAAEGLVTMGLLKTNPAEAWRRMKPVVQKLLVAAGEVLPDDLRQRVQAGEMSADAALEVSRARAGVNSQRAYSQFEQQRQQRSAAESSRQALTNAASEWEADRRRKDPNFGAKLEPLMDRVYALQRKEGVPSTSQGVQDQLTRAYKGLAVPAAAAPAQKRPITPVRGGQVAGKAAPEAKSMLDIVRANRRSA